MIAKPVNADQDTEMVEEAPQQQWPKKHKDALQQQRWQKNHVIENMTRKICIATITFDDLFLLAISK